MGHYCNITTHNRLPEFQSASGRGWVESAWRERGREMYVVRGCGTLSIGVQEKLSELQDFRADAKCDLFETPLAHDSRYYPSTGRYPCSGRYSNPTLCAAIQSWKNKQEADEHKPSQHLACVQPDYSTYLNPSLYLGYFSVPFTLTPAIHALSELLFSVASCLLPSAFPPLTSCI